MPLRKNAKVELIRSVPLFSRCTRKELEAIAAEADELVVPDGRQLTRQGEKGTEFIVIVEGSADVEEDGRIVNRLGDGDFVGEIALISDVPRTATVTTTSRTLALILTDRAFRRVVKQVPSVQGSLLKALTERLQSDDR
jgi:CRP-like cAMP-binding protein